MQLDGAEWLILFSRINLTEESLMIPCVYKYSNEMSYTKVKTFQLAKIIVWSYATEIGS